MATLDSIRCQQLKINTPGFSTSKGSVPGIEQVFPNLKHGVVAEDLGTLWVQNILGQHLCDTVILVMWPDFLKTSSLAPLENQPCFRVFEPNTVMEAAVTPMGKEILAQWISNHPWISSDCHWSLGCKFKTSTWCFSVAVWSLKRLKSSILATASVEKMYQSSRTSGCFHSS